MTDLAPGSERHVTLIDPQGRVVLHPLQFLDEDDEVTVGRPEVGEFVVLPVEGAALLRRLIDGASIAEAASWFENTYGETIDVADFVADLDELGFVRRPGEQPGKLGGVRWQRLGRAVFSPVGAISYAVLLAAWVTAMFRNSDLVPKPHNLIFTHYMSVLVLTLFLAQIPLLLIHEAAHALAGRRLGLHSTLSIGRRLQFIVFETNMNGLVAVPRRQRYLPILAGMMTDLGASAALCLLAGALRGPDGSIDQLGAIALSLSYLTLMRFVWQFFFFLRTDIFYLVVTVLGCVDLHTAARQQLANRWQQLRGRPLRYDPQTWHPRDRAVARWYAYLMALGYLLSITSFLVGWLPALAHVLVTAVLRLFGSGAQGWRGLVDSIVFFAMNSAELLIVLGLAVRQRRAARQRQTATLQAAADHGRPAADRLAPPSPATELA